MKRIARVMLLLSALATVVNAAKPTGWVCFAGASDGKVYRVRVGGSVETLTGNVGAKHARWSADGKLIFYINGSGKIWAMTNDGGDSWEIGSGKVLSGSSIAAYRPDASCVLSAEDSKFYKIDAYTKKKTLVTDVNKGGIYGEIAISDDGKRIAFRDGNPTWHNVTTGATREYNSRCSAGISPNGNRLIANNGGHQNFSLYSFDGSSHSKIDDVGYNGVLSSGDNQAFCVNSNDWVCVLVDNAGTNYGKACGIVNISTNECYQVASWSSSKTMYPDFFLGSLPGLVQYTLTVENGSGDGSYSSGATVNIAANTPPSGKQFDRWTGDVANVANVTDPTTTLTMPAANITVTATYKDRDMTQYSLTVNRGSGDGQYVSQTEVAIAADAAAGDSVFDRWTGDVASVANVTDPTTTITMPAANVTVTATYRKPATTTKILSPSNGCELAEGTSVTLTADGNNVSWSYDANSDGLGSVPIGTGNSVQFEVPLGVTGPRTIEITATGDNGSDKISGSIVEASTAVRLTHSTTPVTFAVTPNPCRSSATITFTLQQRRQVELAVYDMTGKRIARVAHGSYDAGNHAVAWDGRDFSGNRVVNGAYTAVLETAGERKSLRLLMTR